MAIKAYVGRMGSGKSYEVVSVVILDALRRGRRVVSNIAGLDYEAMCDVLEGEGVLRGSVGELIHVEHKTVCDPKFWRTDKDDELGVEAFIQPGDLIALDEVWRFWSGFAAKGVDGEKRPDRVMNFFRMHRHFTHSDTGVACDVALITQDIMDISRQVRAVIEETYLMTKHTAVGSTKRYRVDVHQGGKISRSPIRSIQRVYDARFFPLYSSHSQKKEGGADAREENIDGRGNILRGAIFKVVLPVAVLVGVFAVWMVVRFFSPSSHVGKDAAMVDSSVVSQAKEATARAGEPVMPKVGVSESWRVVGWFTSESSTVALLEDGERRHRYLYDPPAIKIRGLQVSVVLPEGETATGYSGRAVVDKALPGGKL